MGEAFNAVSPQAINLRGYAEAMFRWFGHEPKLRFQPFDQWKADQSPEDAQTSWEHIVRSSCHSIEKARRLLGYEPRYSSLAAVQEAVSALIAAGRVEARPRIRQSAAGGPLSKGDGRRRAGSDRAPARGPSGPRIEVA